MCLVSGGRIDHAHHSTKAHLALDETVEFAKAIQAAVDMTEEKDTLIVVTSDHGHTLTISGYPSRGTDIFGTHLPLSMPHKCRPILYFSVFSIYHPLNIAPFHFSFI